MDRLLPKGATRADAYRLAAQMDDLAAQIKLGKLKTAHSLTDTVKKWLVVVATHTERTLDLYQRVIGKFIDSLPPGIMTVQDVSAVYIQNYLEAVLEKNTARTANSNLTVIKSFCRWFGRLYDIANPADQVDFLSEEPPARRFLSQDEYDKILVGCRDTTRDLFLFLSNTGLRVSEFVNLKWIDIETDFSSLSIIGKGRKRRAIPLNKKAQQVLHRRLQDKRDFEFAFLSKSSNPKFNGQPMTRRGLYETCAGVARRVGIPAFGPHAFRHWFATQLLIKGLPIIKVSMLMGHASTRLTQSVYAHILPGDLKGATDCLNEKPQPQSKGSNYGERSQNEDRGTVSIAAFKKQIGYRIVSDDSALPQQPIVG